jgi:hypothetical protein
MVAGARFNFLACRKESSMKKKITKLVLKRESLRLIEVTAGLPTLVRGCQTGATQCGSSSPPETCPPA